jgi:hypothetical protein
VVGLFSPLWKMGTYVLGDDFVEDGHDGQMEGSTMMAILGGCVFACRKCRRAYDFDFAG